MEAAALPRAFPNLGRWCWVNALLQALSSIDDSRWWAILAPEPQAPDLLAALAVALRWIGRRDAAAERRESVPPAHIMAALERGLEAECRLSPSAEQDVHEALLQVLEAAIDGLSRRELAAALRSRAAPATAGLSSWAPAWPWAAGALGWVAARAARRDFLALWEGTLEEARVCLACGFEKVDREPGRQAFRCLSLELPQAPAADLPAMLASAYGGGATERLEEVVCAACSLEAALRRFRYAAARGSLAALAACRRLRACADMAGQPLEPELLAPLCPPGVAPPQLCRAPHLRTFRIALPPTILAIHLRRLVLSPWGGQAKAQARVRCPPTLLLASRRTPCPPGGAEGALVAPQPRAPPGSEDEAAATAPAARDARPPALEAFRLCASVSHLGPATGGHFLAHRLWTGRGAGASRPCAGAAHVLPCSPLRPLAHVVAAAAAAAAPRGGRDGSAGGAAPEGAAAPGGCWVRADDDRVAAVSQAEALAPTSLSYLLLYERDASPAAAAA